MKNQDWSQAEARDAAGIEAARTNFDPPTTSLQEEVGWLRAEKNRLVDEKMRLAIQVSCLEDELVQLRKALNMMKKNMESNPFHCALRPTCGV